MSDIQLSAICNSALVQKGSLSLLLQFIPTYTKPLGNTPLLGHPISHTYTHMLPVKLMCGHLCGLHITATTAICNEQREITVIASEVTKMKCMLMAM